MPKYTFDVNIISGVLIMENNNEVNNLEKEKLKNEETNIKKGKNNKRKFQKMIAPII